jgi:hypothetical protein
MVPEPLPGSGELDTGAPCHQVTPLHTACRPLATLPVPSADRCVQLCHTRHGRRCEWQRQGLPPPLYAIYYTDTGLDEKEAARRCVVVLGRPRVHTGQSAACMHMHARIDGPGTNVCSDTTGPELPSFEARVYVTCLRCFYLPNCQGKGKDRSVIKYE